MTSTSPIGSPAAPGNLKNWAGNHTYGVSSLLQPGSIEEARAMIKKYDRLKILGTRHCFNNIADSKHHLLSLGALDKIGTLDKTGHTVTVQAGVRYGELASFLDNQGWALHNLASLPHISIAGGCATATHGSGVNNGNLSTAVRTMTFLTASGEIVTLSRDRDKEVFPGAVVHLGAIGVITELTLDIQPAYQLRQYVYEDLPMHRLEHHFDEIMSAGYSVSLFTDWRNKNFNEVWVKARMETGFPAQHLPTQKHPFPHDPSDFFGATPATRDLHPIRDISAEHCTAQMGIPGPWHERLPHFKMDFTPSSGKELQTEYFIPRDKSYAAIQAMERLHEKIAPHLLTSEIRSIAADDLWMSPCYRQPSTAIHFTWQQDWPAVSRLLPLIEEQLAPFHARPHWGKLFTMPPSRISMLYEKLPDFQKLRMHYDPKGKFSNEYLETVIPIG